jgi:threonine dehydrogenase-like Zn-dependent dehydrogenase
MKIQFQAFEYTSQGDFQTAEYEYQGDVSTGWEIFRNAKHYLALGKGYQLLKSKICGICATDIDRRFLPYPLPQIIGHEVVAQSLDERQRFVVEINDTPYYRGENPDVFCSAGLYTHSPNRMVLGIDRLPGGFGPYILAPQHAVIPVDDIEECTAVLTEPFAAALQAVIASPPGNDSMVAVLGPRRLGSLLIAALNAYRKMSGKRYRICALSRHRDILDTCLKLGADKGIDLSNASATPAQAEFDIVYDTTGTVSGFEQALKLATQEIHLKSTNGQPMCGLNNLTAFVVDELALLPYKQDHLDFMWANENRKNERIYLSPGIHGVEIEGKAVYRGDLQRVEEILNSEEFRTRLPRFDLAVASTLEEIDRVIRPRKEHENALIRPRGAILFRGDPHDNPLLNFIARGGVLRSSRCGDFHVALEVLKDQRKLADDLRFYLISHLFPISELKTAFACAQDKKSYKVIVKHT